MVLIDRASTRSCVSAARPQTQGRLPSTCTVTVNHWPTDSELVTVGMRVLGAPVYAAVVQCSYSSVAGVCRRSRASTA